MQSIYDDNTMWHYSLQKNLIKDTGFHFVIGFGDTMYLYTLESRLQGGHPLELEFFSSFETGGHG